MKLYKGLCVIAGCLSLLSMHSAYAQDITLRYSELYSRLKHNLAEEHAGVNVHLFLVDQQGKACVIHKASMQKDAHYEELAVPADYALSIPLDGHLRKANPDVTFVIDDGITCDLSMQVAAINYDPHQLSQTYVKDIVPQMNSMMSELGGMFSRWFMPKVEGVVITFDEPNKHDRIRLENGSMLQVKNGVGRLHLDDLSPNETLSFENKISKISPWFPAKHNEN